MKDITSKLRAAGLWCWGQKEKMFLGALLVVLCFRVYVLLVNPPGVTANEGPPTKIAVKVPPPKPGPGGVQPAGAPLTAENVPDPPPRPASERPEDVRPLVRQNPFTIHSAVLGGQSSTDAEGDTIDVTLNSIRPWGKNVFRAELTTKGTGKSKYYAEGESFENYKLMTIDPTNKLVTIYSSAHDKTFELKIP